MALFFRYCTLSHAIKNACKAFTLSSIFISSGYAVEFNIHVMDVEDRDNVDLTQFERKGYISPGQYQARVKLNDLIYPQPFNLIWKATNDDRGSFPCFSEEQIATLGLNEDIISKLHNGECNDLTLLQGLKISLDKEHMLLLITVPQAWLRYNAKDWTPPEFWDEGIAGVFLDYNLFASHYSPDNNSDSQNLNSYGTAGINLGAWRLRSDYQYSQNFINGHSEQKEFEVSQTYLFRPIPAINSKLTLGQFDSRSDIYDSFRMSGVMLESDERMLPPDLQGYAPKITGIARTNAIVTVKQNERVIYQTTVTPGPFSISDINESVQGSLDVNVEEEDGSVSTFQVGAADIPYLTREGQVRYKTSLGKPTESYSNNTISPTLFMGELSWGWLSNTSLYGGMIVTDQSYQSGTAGIGFNFNALGALSFDTTYAQATLNDDSNLRGYSYRVNYSKHFDATDSHVTFAGYRFSDKDYVSINEYINDREYSDDNENQNEKESYLLTFNQYVSAMDINIYLNLSRNTYWDASSSTSYSLSVGKTFDIADFKNINASLMLSRANYNGEDENQYYLSFSLPLSNNRTITASQSKSGNGNTQSISYYDSSDRNNSWNISASGDNDDWGKLENSFRGSYQHASPYGRFSAAGSVQPNDYISVNTSWSGSLTATKHGAALHSYNNANNSRIMVDADHISGISLNGNRAVTNSFGVAVVPSLTSYQTVAVRVDNDKLPDGVDVNHSVIQSTFTEGAIGYTSLDAVSGKQIIGYLRYENGKHPPVGISVFDSQYNRDVGLIAEDGFVYLSGIKDDSKLVVKTESHECEVILSKDMSTSHDGPVLLPCKIH